MAAGIPRWEITGIVTETRPLTTKDTKTVWAYSVKLMAMGGVFELQTKDEVLYKQFGDGSEVTASGRFEQFNGSLKLMVQAVKKAS